MAARLFSGVYFITWCGGYSEKLSLVVILQTMFAGDRILPTGIGHTTSCFLQVEGGDEQVIFIPCFCYKDSLKVTRPFAVEGPLPYDRE